MGANLLRLRKDVGVEMMSEINNDGEINIRIVRKTFMGKPTHWEIEAGIVGQVDGGIEGTAPTMYGVTDMFFEYLDEIDDKRWSRFDANEHNRSK